MTDTDREGRAIERAGPGGWAAGAARSGRGRWARVALALVVTTSGCVAEGLAFRVDDRVEVTAPTDRETVRLPLEVRWSARDLPRGTRFVVFVDQTPMPPGESLDWVARDDDGCKAAPGCPDERYLADRHVHVTGEPRIVIPLVPVRSTDREYRDFHEVTVVLLDAAGRRQEESAWSVQFRVER